MELTIAGMPYRLGPGDVGVIGSNELHNAKNVGTGARAPTSSSTSAATTCEAR